MKNRFNLLYKPEETWQTIKSKNFTIPQVYVRFLIFMALIPVVAAFIGTVYIGWQVGSEEATKLTPASALRISIAAYFGMLAGAYIFSHFVRWMAKTYGSDASLADCFALIVYSACPLFLASIVSIYPILWLDTLVTIAALAYSVRLLFIGTPIMMGVNQEKGFLFTNSILAVAMVLAVGSIAISVLFWGMGVAPEFTA
ncbi:Yip1 family protein [Kangiella sp. TOML190]|uniref:Yip1 family protein n=1 Tax=Kangiella sp. TOML190 TaxID=2931351 RepID=UPI00203FEED0|nr:Yip1 family protein [Kangiella sp. TOML190]